MDAMGGILTKGLGNPACSHLILGPLRLHCGEIPHTGGGHSVRKGSDVAKYIANRSQGRYDNNETGLSKPKKQITITFSVNNRTHEKTYIVEQDRADKVIKAINWIHETRKKLRIFLSKFRKIKK